MVDVVIETSGGVIQNVAVSCSDVRVVVIDWDEIECVPAGKYRPGLWPVASIDLLTPQTRRLYKKSVSERGVRK